ncbi:MAG: hypothetical protein QOJ40_2060 [Verrucomicrobiota bacterium]
MGGEYPMDFVARHAKRFSPTCLQKRRVTMIARGHLKLTFMTRNPEAQMKKPITTTCILTVCLASTVMAQRPVGIDVSSYQGSPNWGSIKSCGWSFAWAKATEGVSINDADYRYNINNAKASGVYVGAYHFAHPNLNSPSSEANHFWGVISGDIQNDGKSLQPVLDFEVFSGVVGAGSYSDWANQFNNIIKNNAAAKGVTVKPVLYTSACSACNFDGSVSEWLPWIADYNGQSPQSGTPWSTCSGCDVWSDWIAWQYNDAGSVCGVSGGCDVDVFNGDTASMVSTLVINGNSSSSFAPGPAAVSWGPNRIDVLVRGGGDAIYHKYWDGSAWQPSGGFEKIGGISAYGPGLSATGVNRLDGFCAATDYSLRHKWWDGTGWYPDPHWENIGGVLTSSPAAVSWGPGRIDVVARGGQNHIYHKYWDGTAWQPSGGFENIGGVAVGQPAICSWGPGRLDVFYRGTDNALWHNYFTGGAWAGEQSLGGVLTSGPAAVAWGSGRIDVVVRGGQNKIYHKYYVSGQGWLPSGGFEVIGGTSTSDPGISSWGAGRLDVFCRGTDNALWHAWYSGGTWYGFQSLGGVLQ